jgi:hypothetical protein
MKAAMEALLAHDQQRLKTDEKRKNKKLNDEDREAIAIRASLADESPENFWAHPYTQHHRYLRFTPNEAENLKFAADDLSRSALRHKDYYDRGLENEERYANRMMTRDGGRFEAKHYTDALMEVQLETGAVLDVDIAD